MKATFEADFSTFKTAVDQAVVQLRSFETDATKTGDALSAMADRFTGRKVIEEATLMAAAVKQVGGVAALSAKDLDTLAKSTAAAADRFLAFGKDVPAEMQQTLTEIRRVKEEAAAFNKEVDSWSATTIKATTSHTNLNRTMAEFNNLLAASGLHVSNELGALAELGTVAGQTVTQFGLLGTAGLVVGTAIGSWKLAQKVEEVQLLNTAIAEGTAKLLGWGDAAGQRAAAAADTLAAASRRAGESITSMAEALAINQLALDELSRKQAPADTADQFKKWAGEVALVEQSGVLKTLDEDIRSHHFSMQFLADKYKLSTEALGLYAKRLQEVDDLEKKHAADRKRSDDAFSEQIRRGEEARAKAKKAAEDAAKDTQHWTDRVHELEQGFTKADESLLNLLRHGADQRKMTQAGFDLAAKQGGGVPLDTANPFAVFTDDLKRADEELKRNIALGEDRLIAELHQKDQIAAANQKFLDSMLKAATAADAFTKGLTAPAGGDITPWSSLVPKPIAVKPIKGSYLEYGDQGLGTNQPLTDWNLRSQLSPNLSPTVNIQVSGILDPRTTRELATAVGDEWMRRTGRNW